MRYTYLSNESNQTLDEVTDLLNESGGDDVTEIKAWYAEGVLLVHANSEPDWDADSLGVNPRDVLAKGGGGRRTPMEP